MIHMSHTETYGLQNQEEGRTKTEGWFTEVIQQNVTRDFLFIQTV